jgi:hypothetical protein
VLKSIIWPLAGKIFCPVFLQQRPRWTGGLQIPVLPVLPWNDADRPPSIGFGIVEYPPTALDVAPKNIGLAALNLVPVPLQQFLHPQRPRVFYEQFFLPSVVNAKLPATDFRIFGVTKDSAGVVLPGCTVHLFRTSDDVLMKQITSDAAGAYMFQGVGIGGGGATAYYVVAYKAGSPDVSGTTVNTLTGA